MSGSGSETATAEVGDVSGGPMDLQVTPTDRKPALATLPLSMANPTADDADDDNDARNFEGNAAAEDAAAEDADADVDDIGEDDEDALDGDGDDFDDDVETDAAKRQLTGGRRRLGSSSIIISRRSAGVVAGAATDELLDEDKSTSSPCSAPDSAAGCRDHHHDQDHQALEIERACMEAPGQVSIKWDITRKNKNSIVINGYKMTESRAGKDGRVFWRCSKRFCSATAISLGPRLLSVRQVDEARFHNHPPTGKEEFFRGDFSAPGTPTAVTVKWPVLRATSAKHQQQSQTPRTPVAVASDSVSVAAATPVSGASDAAPGRTTPSHQHQHQHQHHLSKRMRHGSLESGGSSSGTTASEAAVLADPLLSSLQHHLQQQRLQPQPPPHPPQAATSGSVSVSDAHKAFISLASSLGVMSGYPGLFPGSLIPEAAAAALHQQQQQQHQQQQQAQQQHQQSSYLSNHLATKTYHSIFNPPPPLPQPQQSPHHHHHPAAAAASSSAAASPLKEALSQVDNYQLQRQLRRLDGYFRAGIVSLADTIVRQGGLVARDAEFVAWERDSMTRLFAYMDGLERVHKLSGDLV